GERMLTYTAALEELPLFVRDGAVLPYFAGPLRNGCMDLSAVELHLFCHEQPARFEYALDDQKTQRYETGAWSSAGITAEVQEDRLMVTVVETGHYPRETVTFTPVIYGRPEVQELELTLNGRTVTRPLQTEQREWLCRMLPVRA
ncbi:MAG: hypothetical protein LM549_00990, partial [Candidatus Competibacter sp.]|nr:hypothetical protein [Candidatus Competibacter sp.]